MALLGTLSENTTFANIFFDSTLTAFEKFHIYLKNL